MANQNRTTQAHVPQIEALKLANIERLCAEGKATMIRAALIAAETAAAELDLMTDSATLSAQLSRLYEANPALEQVVLEFSRAASELRDELRAAIATEKDRVGFVPSTPISLRRLA